MQVESEEFYTEFLNSTDKIYTPYTKEGRDEFFKDYTIWLRENYRCKLIIFRELPKPDPFLPVDRVYYSSYVEFDDNIGYIWYKLKYE